MAYCMRCREAGAYPRNYESVSGNEATMNHCSSCYSDITRYLQNESSELRQRLRERQEEDKKKKEEEERQEQEKKINEWKASHCAKCNKYSNVYHYIYDKSTNKLEKSYDNASNSDKQWVFCTENHFKEWYKEWYYKCLECNQTGLGNCIVNKTDSSKRFCSRECSRNYYAEDCNNCGNKATGKSYYQDSENKTGTLCSKCYELKQLEEQIKKLKKEIQYTCQQCGADKEGNYTYNKTANDGKKFCSSDCFNQHYTEQCDKCSKNIKANEKSYYQDAKSKTGTLCSACWQSKKDQENNNPTPTDTPPPTEEEERTPTPINTDSPPSQTDGVKCQDCNIEIGVGTHCGNCFRKKHPKRKDNPKLNITPSWKFSDSNSKEDDNFKQSFNEIQESINEGHKLQHTLPVEISKQQRIFLKAWQDAQISKKNVDIEKLDLPREKKEELRQLFSDSNLSAYAQEEGITWRDLLLPIGGVLVGITILVIIIKVSRRKAKMRKRK